MTATLAAANTQPYAVSLLSALGLAAACFIASVAATALIAWRQLAFLRDRHSEHYRSTLRAFIILGAWLAPLAVMALRAAWPSILAAALFGGIAGAAFRRLYQVVDEEVAQPFTPGAPFSLIEPEESGRAAASKLAAGTLYGSAILGFLGAIAVAALMAGIGCALVRWHAARTGATNGSSRMIAKLGAAFAVTVLAFALQLAGPLGGTAGAPGPESTLEARRGGLHSGVILLAEPRVSAPLLAPHTQRTTAPGTTRPASPVSIPFTGEYWYFFWPLRRPSIDAIRKPGDPRTLTYRDVAGGQLVMQAVQSLPRKMSTHCCAEIVVFLENEDLQPEMVSVQMILTDSTEGRGSSFPLGTQALPESIGKKESLRFPVPSAPASSSFDRIVLWFNLKGVRRHRSANIAIDRFELIPTASGR